MSGFVDYGKATSLITGRPSPSIWADCPVITFLRDPAKGFHIFEDFLTLATGDATTESGFLFYPYIIASGSIALADDEKGVVVLDHNDSDNDDVVITTGDNTTGLLVPVDGGYRKWWFEARVKVASITTDDIGWFVGLTQEGQAADGSPLTDATAAVNAIDHVGFNVLNDAGSELDFVWNLAGQTAQKTSNIHTVVANTYVQMGMKYEPSDNKVHCYVNGVEKPDAAFLLSHASAPLDNLAVTFALKGLTNVGAADTMSIDWVRIAGEY